MQNSEESLLLSVKDVMNIMGCGRDKAYEIMHCGDFPVMKFGRQLKVHKNIFHDWLENKRKNTYIYKL